MFDIFGIEKEMQFKDMWQSVACGITKGLVDSFDYKLDYKDMQIQELQKKIKDLEIELEKNKKEVGL